MLQVAAQMSFIAVALVSIVFAKMLVQNVRSPAPEAFDTNKPETFPPMLQEMLEAERAKRLESWQKAADPPRESGLPTDQESTNEPPSPR